MTVESEFRQRLPQMAQRAVQNVNGDTTWNMVRCPAYRMKPAKKPQYTVFLSHSSRDSWLASVIAQKFRAAGRTSRQFCDQLRV